MMHIEKGEKHSFWADSLPAGLSVVRTIDRAAIVIWLLALAVCLAYMFWRIENGTAAYEAVTYLALPFAAVGFIHFIYRKNIIGTIMIAAVTAAMVILKVEFIYIYVFLYIVFGATGVACIVDAIQRTIFYKVVYHVRYANVKDKLGVWDKLTVFIFSIPPDLDTRNISIDLKRAGNKFPWGDLWNSVGLSLMVGMFFWIYISMNPMFMVVDFNTSVPLFVFTVMLYVPIVILPFSIFRSLNAKIGTNYRDFKLYNGAVATIQRMAVPVLAALLYVLLALGSNDMVKVLSFIALSAVMIFVVVLVTSAIYYYWMEASIVSDIGKKWKIFMPVPLLVSLRDEAGSRPVFPGTPTRDESDIGGFRLNVINKK